MVLHSPNKRVNSAIKPNPWIAAWQYLLNLAVFRPTGSYNGFRVYNRESMLSFTNCDSGDYSTLNGKGNSFPFWNVTKMNILSRSCYGLLMFTVVTLFSQSFVRQADRQLPRKYTCACLSDLAVKIHPTPPPQKKISKESLDVSWEVTSLVYSVETPPRWTWHRLCLCFMSVDRFLLWTTYLVCAGSSSSDALRCIGALGQGHHCVVSVSTGLTVRVTCLVKSRPKLLISA